MTTLIKNYNPSGSLKQYPTIAFILPSYHEPFEVAKMTFDSIFNLKYRGDIEVIVVDNSRNTTSPDFLMWREYVLSKGAKFIYSDFYEGLKPANLDIGQKHIENAEYVVFLDVDSTLKMNDDVLEKSIIEFNKNDSLGWIQYYTQTTNHNINKCANAIGVYQNQLRITTYFRSIKGFTLFYGHNGIWRKSCLDEIGSWLEYYNNQIIITEDILKCILAYNVGYIGKSIPVNTGEWIPTTLKGLESMWQRWTYGTCQVIGKYFIDIFRNDKINKTEKYDLLYIMVLYWGYALIYPLAVLFMFIFPPQVSAILITIICIIPELIKGIAAYKQYIRYQKTSLIKKLTDFYSGTFIISTFVTVVHIKSIVKYLIKIPEGWKVTPKNNDLNTFKGHFIYILTSVLMLLSSLISWYLNFNFNWIKLLYYAPVIFISINLILSVILYRKSGKTLTSSISDSTIDSIT